jgi:hypothetical protein
MAQVWYIVKNGISVLDDDEWPHLNSEPIISRRGGWKIPHGGLRGGANNWATKLMEASKKKREEEMKKKDEEMQKKEEKMKKKENEMKEEEKKKKNEEKMRDILQRADSDIATRLYIILEELKVCAVVPPVPALPGNCLFEAISSSLILYYSGDERFLRYLDPESGPQALREDLYIWVSKSREPVVERMKYGFKAVQVSRAADGLKEENWETFWSRMRKSQEWAEDIVIHSLSMFLQVDVKQISDKSNDEHPWQLFR